MTRSQNRKHERIYSGLPDTMTANTYNLIIGLCILGGFVVNAIIVYAFGDIFAEMNPIAFLIGYFVSVLVGTIMAIRSHNPWVSLTGYALVVLPIGAVLSIALPAFAMADILSAIVVTGSIVAVMTGLASAYPRIFARMGGALLLGLFLGLIGESIALLLGYSGNLFHWLFVILFSLYVGYDWHRAQMYPKTLDNAIDSALDLYLDIINLFLRILQLMARNRD